MDAWEEQFADWDLLAGELGDSPPGQWSKSNSGASTPRSTASSGVTRTWGNRLGRSGSGSSISASSGTRTPTLFAQLENKRPGNVVPLHIWCIDSPEVQTAAVEAYSEEFRFGQALAFATQSTFTRWLFQQPRGAVTPTSVLVTGWREAKPCAMGIAAARSGNIDGLRPDAARGKLTPVIGNPLKVEVAILMMVVIVTEVKMEIASEWVAMHGREMVGVPVHLTTSIEDVRAMLFEVMFNASRAATFGVDATTEASTTEASTTDATCIAVVPSRPPPAVLQHVPARALPAATPSDPPPHSSWCGLATAMQEADWVGDTIYSL